MTRKRVSVLVAGAAIAAAALGTGLALTSSGSASQPTAATASASPAAASAASYAWYRSMMAGYSGSGSMLNGSSYGAMMSAAGYERMTDGTVSPGWMRGGTLPETMMGTSTDPGKLMGRLWANAPGPRVSPAQAAALGRQIPAGASINRASRTITFAATAVRLAIEAGPADGPDEAFRIAGMTNPAIVVPVGARVSIEIVNADPGTAHGLVITASPAVAARMPMMTRRPAFAGSALWFLGDPTTAGLHAGTITFTAAIPGAYKYLCPVPVHAQNGMAGSFTVR